MGFFSFFRRRSDNAQPPSAGEAEGTARQTRVRARHRLIGAVILVTAGVIGFPLIFETQPRPIPVDIAIEIPRKEAAPPLVMPQSRVVAAASSAAASAPIAISSVAPASTPPRPPASTGPLKSEPAAVMATRPGPPAAAEAARAQALLDGKDATLPALAKAVSRFVVQVGAFAENTAAQETRVKVEKLGLKTYVQVANTDAGKRIRVRVGPFSNKEEASQAKDRLKAAGLPAVLLTL